MPQYIMPISQAKITEFNQLDSFTQGYIECMFWTDANEDNEELKDMRFDNLSDKALKDIIEECKDFQESNKELLNSYYEKFNEENAGHDFWLTRNGHGCGFWDRRLGKLGDKLTKAAKVYGGCDLCEYVY